MNTPCYNHGEVKRMDIFKKIATALGVAVIGYFGFYFVCVFYNMIAFLFGGKDSQNTMAILTAIIVMVIYLIKSRRQ